MSDATDAAIETLKADVTALADKEAAAVTLLNGLASQLQAALAAAQNKGATPAQLSDLNDLNTKLSAMTVDLAQAITADTPAPPPPPAGDDSISAPAGGDTVPAAPGPDTLAGAAGDDSVTATDAKSK